MVESRPYGSWPSPIGAGLVAGRSGRIGSLQVDGAALYWLEGRPAEGGRNVIVRWRAGEGWRDLLPPPYSARSRVHEYGGGALTVCRGVVYFVNDRDQRLYRLTEGGGVSPITPEGRPYRYANCVVDERRNRLICVREDHTDPRPEGVINTLVAVRLPYDAEGGEVLASGHDFYAEPRLSPDGRRLAWLTWDHPRMPWDGTMLWMAELDGEGHPVAQRAIAGGEEESVCQPEWDSAGRLYFVSDRSNWWNLYRWAEGAVQALHPMEAEFAMPPWVLGLRSYVIDGSRLYAIYMQNGYGHLALLDLRSGAFSPIETPYTYLGEPQCLGDRLILRAASPTEPLSIVAWSDGGRWEVIRRMEGAFPDAAYLSLPQPIAYESGLGEVYAFFYPPHNPDVRPPREALPPLIVIGHGGPTSATIPALKLAIQFWTSRGFAVLDVNYGGSTGYGRRYRNRLRGNWGVVDVEDMVQGARYLVGAGQVDGERLLIRGGSAGGFTVLAALTFHETFTAGASYYGIGDLEALTRETHKFESHYLDSLVGPYPQQRDLYLARSPIHHIERLSRPVIFFQGDEDRVVPPNQAEMMVEALKSKGVPVAYLLFHGEGHGFRQEANLRRSLEAELYFYGRILGFHPADEIEPVPIIGLD